jgi:aminoglycoside phosphotransferase family enzyme
LTALVGLLAAFYRSAPRVALGGNDYLARFQYEQASNREILLRPQFQLRDAALAMDRFDTALSLVADLLRTRASGLHIVDGHGDLRPDHVFLMQPPAIIDCLEFNPQLRQLDPMAELAYLSLECTIAGAPWVGPLLVDGVANALGDRPLPCLLDFYTAHSALLRARLAMAHLLDPQPRLPQKWAPLAARYIAHAMTAATAIIATRPRGSP